MFISIEKDIFMATLRAFNLMARFHYMPLLMKNEFTDFPHHSGQVFHNLFIPKAGRAGG